MLLPPSRYSTLKEVACLSQTLTTTYQATRRHNPEDYGLNIGEKGNEQVVALI
jgi:hypothetical protein